MSWRTGEGFCIDLTEHQIREHNQILHPAKEKLPLCSLSKIEQLERLTCSYFFDQRSWESVNAYIAFSRKVKHLPVRRTTDDILLICVTNCYTIEYEMKE